MAKFRLWMVLLLVVGMSVAGCANSRQAFSATNDTFNATVATLNAAYDVGSITQEDWDNTVEPTIQAGNTLLNSYDAMTKAGFDGDVVAEQLKDVIKKLQPFITTLINH